MGSMIETGILGDAGKQEHQILNTGVGFSGRQSELTCNASGSRKRAREDSMALPSLHNLALSPLIPVPGVFLQSRSLESGATSTSGRHVPSSQAIVSPPVRDLVSLLLQQNLEIDALVRVQSEMLRAGLEEARKRHCRALLSMLEQQAAKRLMEKDAELETASRRNAELEEKVRQLSEENRMWFTMAKNNEAIACGLRTSMEQAILQGAAAGHERCGDDDGGGGAAFPVDDAQSCCFEVEERRKACKACGERDVCVLLLPCRHVCVCKDCESKADTAARSGFVVARLGLLPAGSSGVGSVNICYRVVLVRESILPSLFSSSGLQTRRINGFNDPCLCLGSVGKRQSSDLYLPPPNPFSERAFTLHLHLETDVDGEAQQIRIEKGGGLEMSSISLSLPPPLFSGGGGSDFGRMLFSGGARQRSVTLSGGTPP
ncbi:hypothetical protein BHM03_00045931 [Ensete ventricosum]|nr:hypothetical protein BHM03_00045931 [Ensete ventricosum]